MRIKTLLLTITLTFALSCSNKLITLENGKKIDQRLIGTWIGSEKDKQIEGAEKSWEMIRKIDGTFVLDFKLNDAGEIIEFTETGNWWVENGKFYEYHDDSGKTDIYDYIVLDENRIKFISILINVEMNSENYEFIDTRK